MRVRYAGRYLGQFDCSKCVTLKKLQYLPEGQLTGGLLQRPEGTEGVGLRSEVAVGVVEQFVGSVLVQRGTLLATLGWTRDFDECLRLFLPRRISLLSLHVPCVLVVQQVGAAVVFPLGFAYGVDAPACRRGAAVVEGMLRPSWLSSGIRWCECGGRAAMSCVAFSPICASGSSTGAATGAAASAGCFSL